jgi:hypothetical protein
VRYRSLSVTLRINRHQMAQQRNDVVLGLHSVQVVGEDSIREIAFLSGQLIFCVVHVRNCESSRFALCGTIVQLMSSTDPKPTNYTGVEKTHQSDNMPAKTRNNEVDKVLLVCSRLARRGFTQTAYVSRSRS